jgi:hypothetical protein
MIMKKKVLALSVAAALTGGLAGPASAVLNVVDNGIGHMLLVPYFTTQGGNSTLLNLVNTDTVNGKAVKIRFRGGVDSDDIFDFQLFMSPGDMWTANISQTAGGLSTLTTSDKSCTLPASVNADFITARLASFTSADGVVHGVNEQTREGYVEIFNMADIPPTLPGTTTANALFTTIKHVSNVAPCTSTVLLGIEAAATAGAWVASSPAAVGVHNTGAYPTSQQVVIPTGTLMGNWTVINVPSSLAFSGAMPAVVSTGSQTIVVYSGQTATGVTATASSFTAASGSAFPNVNQTADAVLVNQAQTGVLTAKYDFPDMSTPYETASLSPTAQALALSTGLQRAAVINEFITDPTISAATDWVLSIPTRRYHVAGRGANYGAAADNKGWTVGESVHAVAGGVTAPFVTADVTYSSTGRSSCIATGAAPVFWNREETTSGPSGAVISPGTPTLYTLCGEVNVLAWNNSGATSGALKATLILANSAATGTTDGWARVVMGAGAGLPVLGSAFTKAYNPAVSAGVAGNFGGSWKHRFQ